MTAVGLLRGSLTADDYEEEASRDPLVDYLRDKMNVVENKQYSIDYLDPEKRSIANAITIRFKDGTSTPKVAVEYPIGHRRRREEGIPMLFAKFEANMRTHYSEEKVAALKEPLFADHERLCAMPVNELMDMLAK